MHRNILALIILLSIVIGACTLTRGHQWGDDFAWYIYQAKSLVTNTTGEFMQVSEFTNRQSTQHLGPLAYPWGYPLILAPVYALKGISPLALKLPALLFFAGFLICLYLLVKRYFTPAESLLFVALFAFNPLLLQFLDQILSDIPFLFFSTLSLLLMVQEGKRGLVHYALLGAAIFGTTIMRVTGVLLLGCFLIVEFFRLLKNRQERAAALEIIRNAFIVCVVFAVLWVLNLLLFPSGGESYLSQYANLLETARTLAPVYFNVFSQFFGEAPSWRYLYYLVLVFFLWGAWERRKQETVFLLFFAFWLLVHVTYHWWQGPRYIFPLLPIFVYFAFQGMKAAVSRLPQAYRLTGQRTFYGFWLLLAGIFLFTSGRSAYVNLQNNRTINGPFDPYSMEVYSYIKEQTPADSVVIFFKPRVMIIMTDHLSIFSTECDRMLKGDYLVLSRKVGENQQMTPETIGQCNLPLDQVLKNSRFIVYHIQK